MIHENTQSLHHKINISHNHYVTSPHIASHYLTTYVDKVTVYLYSQMHISCLCIYTRISTLSAVLVYYTYLCSMVYNIYIYAMYIYICIYTKIQLNIWHLCINIHIYNIYIYYMDQRRCNTSSPYPLEVRNKHRRRDYAGTLCWFCHVLPDGW